MVNSEWNNYKKVNLKKNITLGAYAYNSKDSFTSPANPNYWYDNWTKDMYARTTIRVDYVDKYTKYERSEYFYIYRTK